MTELSSRTLLTEATTSLESVGIESARLDAEVLLAHACGIARAMLLSGIVVSTESATRFRAMLGRRMSREPVAYIIGAKEFFSLDFEVTPAVLIPRPETELLVEAALEFVASAHDCNVLDIGTGSGAIAIALAFNAPKTTIDATDISPDALAVARRNAQRHRCEDRVRFLEADLFPSDPSRFNLIVSNPPYVAATALMTLQPEIRQHEPHTALIDGSDGLEFYRRIAVSSRERLKSGGAVMVEVGAGQAPEVEALFRRAGFSNIDAIRDLARIERVIRARRS